jgi:hypothetical protein
MAVPYTFGTATAAIPLSQLDSNFATTITLGNTAIQLGNTVTTLNNMTLANVTISGGTSSITSNSISNGTSNVSIATSGGAVTVATNGATAVTVDTSQNVGIGTSSPTARLQLSSTGNPGLVFDGPNQGTNLKRIRLVTQIAAAGDFAIQSMNDAGTVKSTNLYIDSSGNVGIGTTTPNGKLEVTAAAGSQTGVYFGNQTAGARTDIHVFSASNSDGYIFFERSGASENGYIRYSQSSDFMSFQTASAERMRIDSGGGVRINNTSNATFSAQLNTQFTTGVQCGMYLKVTDTSSSQSMMIFGNSSSDAVGSIATSGSLTSYNISSDYRLKQDIAPMIGALAKVAALKPCTYKWKIDGSDGEGFIAHELAEVCPHAVTGEKDAVDANGNPIHQGMDVSFLVATLTAAIQEQQVLITSLTDRIAALEAK